MVKCKLCKCLYKRKSKNQKYCGSYVQKTGCSLIMHLNPKKQINKKKIVSSTKRRVLTEKSMLYSKLYRLKIKLTVEEYKEMIVLQNNLCAICKLPQENKALAIDHDHITKKVRGLLCQKCNIGIGNMKDSIENLENAIIYLKNYQ